MQLLKFGVLAALAQTIAAVNIHIETTHPPANKYKSHCSVIVEDDLFGCQGSSGPFPGGCGDNDGTLKASICGNDQIVVNWDEGLLTYKGSGGSAHCTLNSVKDGGHCDTDDPDKYPVPSNSGSLAGVSSSLYGLAPMVAAGLLV